jgi:hypothetical protein
MLPLIVGKPCSKILYQRLKFYFTAFGKVLLSKSWLAFFANSVDVTINDKEGVLAYFGKKSCIGEFY